MIEKHLDVVLEQPQKVYVRTVIKFEGLAKVHVGCIENDTFKGKIFPKRGKGYEYIISTIMRINGTSAKGVVILEDIGELKNAEIVSLIVEGIGNTHVDIKKIDKIYYDNKDVRNVCLEESFSLSASNKVVRRQIKGDYERGTLYLIKVLIDEKTNCGNVWLECAGRNWNKKGREIVGCFKYCGSNPVLGLKGNKFEYIIDIKAIVIADAGLISKETFLEKEYWR
jgi:hypothetical protein